MNRNGNPLGVTDTKSFNSLPQPERRENPNELLFDRPRTWRRWKSLFASGIVALFWISFSAHDAAAQSALTNGAYLDATMALGETNLFTFSANSGETVLLRAGRTSGASFFVPWVRLLNPDGSLAGAGTADADNGVSMTVTNSGTFTVLVSSYYNGYAGSYRIHFLNIPGTFTVPAGDEGGAMVNGATYQATNQLGDLDAWTFTATAGETILVRSGRITGNSGFYLPWLRLYGPDGALLASGTDAPDNAVSIVATNSGSFTVVASSYYANYTGTYSIRMVRIPGNFTVSPGDEGGALVNGATYQGTNDMGDLDTWTFTAGVGETILLRAGRVSGNSGYYIPWVRLYGPDGALQGSGSVDPDNAVSIVTTNSGTFTVVVSSYYNDGYTGTYTLRMLQIPGSFTVSPGDEGGALVNGATYQGTNDLGDLDSWTFTAGVGETILLRAGRVSGNSGYYVPWIRLYGPDGALQVSGAAKPDSAVSIVTTNSGTFTAVVSSYYTDGYFGTYNIRMARIPGEITVSPGDEGGAMTNGATYQATNDLGDLDVWTFSAEPGDSIFLRAGRVSFNSGYYVPWLRLYGPNGQLLQSGANNADNVVSIVATNSGTFTVVVSSYYDDGYFGSYTLRLAKIPKNFVVSPGDEGGPLPNGILQTATNSLGDLDMWSFYGTLGDSNVVRFTASGFTADVQLFGPSGTLLRNFTTGTSNSLSYVVTNAGMHTLLVRSSVLGGHGNYTVRLSRVPPDLNVPATQILDEGALLNVGISAQDPDETNKALAFTLISAPPGLTLNPSGNTNATLTWNTTEADGPSTNTIVVSVTDVVNGTAFIRTNSFVVVVNEINEAPELTAPGPQTIDELTALNVSALATDVDLPVNPLTFSLISPPTGMSINPVSGAISWTPTESQGPSTNIITIVVTDTNAPAINATRLSATNSFNVIVREINTPPQLTLPANQIINELASLNGSASAVDSDVPANSLTFSLVAPPSGMTINPASGAISWTPTEAQGPSTNTITVVVSDNNPLAFNAVQLRVTNNFTVTVREVNSAPQLTVPANQTIPELTALNVSASATDADFPANPLTFKLISPPSGMSINATSGAISWTPTEAQGPFTNVISVVVTDTNATAFGNQQLSATNTFTVVVNEVNSAPQLTVPSNQTINELTPLNVSASATDSDTPANPLTFSLVSPPTGMTINAASGAISWTPTEAEGPSTNIVTVIVTDTNVVAPANRRLSATNTFTVTVNEVNLAPVLSAITNQNITFGFLLSVQATATDADLPANTLNFSFTTAPAGMTVNSTNGLIQWTPAQNQVGTHPVTLRVADNGSPSMSATQSFQVTVIGEGSSLAISRASGNLMQITITGDIGLNYELLMSTNLNSWSPLLQFNLSVSPYPYIDPASASQPMRFYKLRRIDE